MTKKALTKTPWEFTCNPNDLPYFLIYYLFFIGLGYIGLVILSNATADMKKVQKMLRA